MSEVLHKSVDLFAYFVESAIFAWFFSRVLRDKYSQSKALSTIIFVLLIGIVPFLLKAVEPSEIAANYFYSYLVLAVLQFVLVLFLKSGRVEEKLFWVISGLTAFVLTSMLSTTLVIALERNIAEHSALQSNVTIITIFAVCKLLQIGLFFILSSQKEAIGSFNRSMTILFAATSVAIGFLATQNVVSLTNDGRPAGVDDFIIPIALMVIAVCFLLNIRSLSKEMGIACRAEIDLNGAKLAEEHFQEAESFYNNIKGLKHDLANHLSVLYGLAEQGDCEGSMAYINSLHGQISASKLLFFTGNNTADIIINSKRNIALLAGVDYRIDADIASDITIPPVDFSIILGNLLDNAIAGCGGAEERKFVELRIRTEKEHLLISIKNSTVNDFAKSGDSKLSELFGEYGIGISQIQRTVENYGGYLLISSSDTEFSVQVNIPLEKEDASKE